MIQKLLSIWLKKLQVMKHLQQVEIVIQLSVGIVYMQLLEKQEQVFKIY